MAVRLPLIVLFVTVCLGCAAPRGMQPDLPTPQSPSRQVIPDIRAVVVGHHADAVRQVITDLQQAGFSVKQGGSAQLIMNTPEIFHEAQSGSSPIGHLSKADVLVVVEVGGPAAYPRVAVNGIDLETGEQLWHGDAAELRGVTDGEYDRIVRELARRALLNGLNTSQPGHKAVLSSLASEALESEISRRFSVESMLADQQEMSRCPSRCHR